MQICGSLTILWHCLSLGLENENQPFPVLWLTPWRSPGLNTGMGSPSLLQGVFPTQGSNPGLPYCGQILYHLSHKGSPRILECSLSLLQQIFPTQESNRGLLHCSWIFFTNWAIRKASDQFHPRIILLSPMSLLCSTCIPAFLVVIIQLQECPGLDFHRLSNSSQNSIFSQHLLFRNFPKAQGNYFLHVLGSPGLCSHPT